SFTQATASNGTDGIQVDAGDNSTSDVSITGSTFTGWNQAPINLSSAGSATQTFNVFSNPTISAGVGQGINVIANNSSTARGFITSNPSITSGVGNNNGVGISLEADVNGRVIANVNGNTVTNFAYGVWPKAREAGNAQLDLTLQNNTVTAGGSLAFAGLFAEAGNGDGQNTRMCMNLVNNNITKGPAAAVVDYSLGQYIGSTFQLQGFVGNGTNPTDVQNFVSSRDVGGATTDVTGGTTINFTAATCATP
ncbi:MAG TPA: hypothetical protein VE913_10025, partial [Longimicrobium sp.]|nr:hypothetical protein [Longimicrobium sp.]